MRKHILCFGDSNTWGYDPHGGRYDEHTRWPMVLEAEMGAGYRVIEEGMNGRTFCFDDPVEGGHKNAEAYLPACLMSANPIEIVCVMLGTNDCKERFGMNGATIAYNLLEFVRLIRAYAFNDRGEPPRILLIAPPPIGENILETRHGVYFGKDAPEKSRVLVNEYHRLARLLRCECISGGDFCRPCIQDAVHLTAEGHIALGRAVAEQLKGSRNGQRIL